MSIDMYLSSSRRQAASVKNMVNRQLEGYNELEQAINQFVFNSNMLTGQAYDSAKRHYSSVLLPLVRGGKLLSQAVAKAVQKFPDEYVSQVHTGDLKESELEGKIRQLEAQIRAKREQQAYLKSLALQLPSEERGAYSRSQRSLGTLIDMLETLVKKLKEKLQKLREFNISSVNIFTEIDGLKRNISAGTQIAGNSWNGSVFVAPSKSQMTWANEINNRWENREKNITFETEWVNAGGGYQYMTYKIFVDGVYDEEQSRVMNELMAEAFRQGIVDGSFQGFHTVGEFTLYNDLYRLLYGKDWLSGDEASRAEALGWLALTALPISKVTQLSKELKAGNKLLKGVSLSSNELKILEGAGYFEYGLKGGSNAGGKLNSVNKSEKIMSIDIKAFEIKNKHLSSSTAKRARKFNVSSAEEANKIVQDALKNGKIVETIPNGVGSQGQNSFSSIIDVGKIIGTKGETHIKIVYDELKNVWTTYPVPKP